MENNSTASEPITFNQLFDQNGYPPGFAPDPPTAEELQELTAAIRPADPDRFLDDIPPVKKFVETYHAVATERGHVIEDDVFLGFHAENVEIVATDGIPPGQYDRAVRRYVDLQKPLAIGRPRLAKMYTFSAKDPDLLRRIGTVDLSDPVAAAAVGAESVLTYMVTIERPTGAIAYQWRAEIPPDGRIVLYAPYTMTYPSAGVSLSYVSPPFVRYRWIHLRMNVTRKMTAKAAYLAERSGAAAAAAEMRAVVRGIRFTQAKHAPHLLGIERTIAAETFDDLVGYIECLVGRYSGSPGHADA